MTHPSSPPMDRPALLASLRARVARLERAGAEAALNRSGLDAGDRSGGMSGRAVPLAPPLDAALPGAAGLPRAALHEILAVGAGAAVGFAAVLLARAGGTVFWIGRDPDAWPPGLTRFGLAPSRLVFARAATPADALWAAEEALRCPAVGGVLLADLCPDATAARRLQLAAETGGGIGLVLRDEADVVDGEAMPPGAATTRWRVSGRAGTGRHELGDPQWTLELLRSRGGRAGEWRVTWRAGDDALVPEGDEADAPEADDAIRGIAEAGGVRAARRR